jgi:hypothetical protein
MQSNPMASLERAAVQHPAAACFGPGHLIVHGNAPFLAEFGANVVGLPASEALIALPRAAFDLMDRVYHGGSALKRRVVVNGTLRTLTVAPRREFGSDDVYGVMLHLVPQE